MVKRYYVITRGLKVGIFFDHWTNIAHLVKDRQGAVWQSASSQQEATELYERASHEGNVRVLQSDQQRFLESSTSFGASPVQRILSSPGTDTSRYWPTSAPRVAGSHSEGHVGYNSPRYVPARANSRETNTGNGIALDGKNGSYSRSSGSGGSKQSKPLSKTHSAPNQQIQDFDFVRRDFPPSRGAASSRRHESTSSSSLSPATAHSTGAHIVRVESPSWLASYPDDDEEETFITPPLSPITSPALPSNLLEPSKFEPASTFANINLTSGSTGRFMSGDRSGNTARSEVRSPKPSKPPAPFPFTYQIQETQGVGTEGDWGNRGRKANLKDERAVGASFATTSRRTTPIQGRPKADVESLFGLLDTVDSLVKDLRANVIYPSIQTDDGSLREPKCRAEVNSLGGPNEVASAMSPRSSPTNRIQRPLQSPNKVPSTLGNPLEPGIPGRSGFPSGRSPNHKTMNSAASVSACKPFNGTGYNPNDDASILDKAGLIKLIHSPNIPQDPRSPFPRSMELRASASPMSCRPSPIIMPRSLCARSSALFASPTRRG